LNLIVTLSVYAIIKWCGEWDSNPNLPVKNNYFGKDIIFCRWKKLATYKQIQNYVYVKYCVKIKTCWIADIKDAHGLVKRPAPNRKGERRYPCPLKYRDMIEDALKYYKMI